MKHENWCVNYSLFTNRGTLEKQELTTWEHSGRLMFQFRLLGNPVIKVLLKKNSHTLFRPIEQRHTYQECWQLCKKKRENKELLKDCIEAPLAPAEVTDAGGLSLQTL